MEFKWNICIVNNYQIKQMEISFYMCPGSPVWAASACPFENSKK